MQRFVSGIPYFSFVLSLMALLTVLPRVARIYAQLDKSFPLERRDRPVEGRALHHEHVRDAALGQGAFALKTPQDRELRRRRPGGR